MNEPFLLGLTGSIGMGKSTTAKMFAECGVPVWDADAVVHLLYNRGGTGVSEIAKIVPEAVEDGHVIRERLRAAVTGKPDLVERIEKVIHPLVAENRRGFIETHKREPMLLFDIPLLFETNAQQWLDGVVVVTAPISVQKERVLSRPGMNETLFNNILGRQTPDEIKKKQADYIVETHRGMQFARERVKSIVNEIRGAHGNA
ncbi:dephospho-CoA kinase [Amaricoccus tamworthensis]|uniref:dephospho-CoA kinase n=1 Tax=Amaricoccus tamworthensis TaxID=57002 RepID=UPI003C7A65DC